MKKCKRNKKAPAYAFGVEQINAAASTAQLLGTGLQSFSEEDSNANIAGSALSGLGTGVAAGAAFGPIGAGIGAVIGGVGGAVSGLVKKNTIQKQEKRQRTADLTQAGLANAAIAEQKYWDKNNLAYTFENGGVLPDLAYLDNNEVVRDDFGNITKVPNTKKGTDNHLVDATTLDSVLSDKLKVPGTNKTFAQEGKKLTSMMKPSKGKDRFAQNSNMLNKINANKAYESLLAQQEEVKAKKGIKPKVKGVPAYEDGKGSKGTTQFIPLDYDMNLDTSYLDNLQSVWNTPYNIGFGNTSTTPALNHLSGATPAGRLPWLPMPGKEPIESKQTASIVTPKGKKSASTKSTNTKTNIVEPKFVMPTLDFESPVKTPTLNAPKGKLKDVMFTEPLVKNKPTKDSKNNGFDFNNLLSLAPTLYNFAQSFKEPEYESTVVNPYASAATRSMTRRRMNIEPTLAANRRARAVASYNAANMNANTGANLALRSQLAADEYARNADLYAARDNANNAYLGEYSNLLNNLGQQYVQSRTLANDINAKNRAAARNYQGTALSQLSKWAQTQDLMGNQYNRDLMILPLLENYLSQGFTADQVKEVFKRTKNRA